MRIIAKYRCQLGGRIYEPGDAADYEGAVTPRIAHNFRAPDGKALAETRASGTEAAAVGTKGAAKAAKDPAKEKAAKEREMVERLAKSTSREALTARLDEMGVTYKATHTNNDLAKLVLRQQGAIE